MGDDATNPSSRDEKLKICIEYLKRICQFSGLGCGEKLSIAHDCIYKFAIILLKTIADKPFFEEASAERLTSVAVITSFNFVNDGYIASDDVASCACKCQDRICKRNRCKRSCRSLCKCSIFEYYIESLKIKVSKEIDWNPFKVYKDNELEMYFLPSLPGRPFEHDLKKEWHYIV